MRTFKTIFVVVVISISLCAGLYYGITSYLYSNTEKSTPLIIGVDSNRPPFVYHNSNGQLIGFTIELSREICKILNRECEIKTYEITELIDAVRNHHVDIALSELVYSPKLKHELSFSMVYYRSRSFFITANNRMNDLTFANAKNLKIGVRAKSRQACFLKETYAVKGAEIREYSTYQNMVSALRTGAVNALFVGGVAGYNILTSPMGRMLFAGGFPEISTQNLDEFRIVSRRTDINLVEQINQSLLELYSNGTFRELSQRYLPTDYHFSQSTHSWTATKE